jgi:plastocyanin
VKRLAAAAALAVLLGGTVSRADAAPAPAIQVRNNVFAPAELRAEPGQRLTWTLAEGKHTVTSDVAGRFDSGVMERSGQTFSFTTPRADVTLFYHCRIHGIRGEGDRWGSGMVGRIVVGKGSPAPALGADVDVRRVPSKRWPTLDASLASLEPDGRYRVELARGVYRPVDITLARLGFKQRPGPRFELTIRGSGKHPDDVVFAGTESLGVSVDGLHLENVSFRRQRFASIFVRGIDRWSIDDVVVSRGPSYGIWIEDARHGRVRRVSITGATVAGISVRTCDECDLLIDSVSIERSLQAISATGSGALVIRGSLFRDNGAGIALKASPSEGTLHRGAHIYVNTFRNNTNRRIAAPALGLEKDLPVGAGVWIDGGAFDVVERNDLTGHSFGVVLTGPSYETRVLHNTLGGSHEADVAWDGLGTKVCLADNASQKGGAATSMPAFAAELYACDLPATMGVPYPLVTARLMLWGSGEGRRPR